MAVKQAKASKQSAPKTSVSTHGDKKSVKGSDSTSPKSIDPVKTKVSYVAGWLQDVSLEVPGNVAAEQFANGDRELEFSVGMRQQEVGGLVRSELRARALVHAQGAVLALVEASYVCDVAQSEVSEALPHNMYQHLRPHLESLLVMSGHTPPLPLTLNQAEQ